LPQKHFKQSDDYKVYKYVCLFWITLVSAPHLLGGIFKGDSSLSC